MQLQAERDHFVHSGIGGGSSSSSSSPSCSPPKDSPLSLIKVNNLKKPRLKARDKDKEKDKDLAKLKAASMDKTLRKMKSIIVNMEVDVDMNLNKKDINMDMDINMDKVIDLTEEKCLPTSLGSIICVSDTEMSTDIGTTKDSSASQQPALSQSQTQSRSLSTSSVPPPPPPPPPPQPIITPSSHPINQEHLSDLRVSAPNVTLQRNITSATTANAQTSYFRSSWTVNSIPLPSSNSTTSHLSHTLIESHPSVYELSLNAGYSFISGHSTDRLSLLPSELFFNVLCRLDALELSRVAQVSKFCARMASDNAVWRVKSIQHPLFSERHIQGQLGAIPWLAYYKFLHQKSLMVKQNWADARPQAVHILEGHTGLVTSLEMSMWTLVTASIDSTLRVWDLRTLQCLQVLHSKHPLNCVAQSESASAACARTSFGGLCIWDTRTGELILQDDTAMPHTASFIYIDESYIGYGQCDGTVTVFDWSSRTSLKIVGSYQAHEGDVLHISILAKKYVVSASTNGETLIYSLRRSCIVERILLPHLTQAVQFTPTLHGDKVMFATRDAVYEYELMLDQLSFEEQELEHHSHMAVGSSGMSRGTTLGHRRGKESHVPLTTHQFMASNHLRLDGSPLEESKLTSSMPCRRRPSFLSSPTRMTPSTGRVWKASNSLLSQIRQRVGGIGKAFDQERLIIPTRFPRLDSIYCLPRTFRSLDHGTTSARDSYGVFMPNNCTHLFEMSVYTRATKQVRQMNGPAVDAVLRDAIRNRFCTAMECNTHCAVVSSGSLIYVISFLPPDV